MLNEVYGDGHDTSDGTFRQLCTDTRSKFDIANCPIKIESRGGKVRLIRRPAWICASDVI